MFSYSVSCSSICLSALLVVIWRDLFFSLFHFQVCQYETVVVNTKFSCHYRILDSYEAVEVRKLTKISKTPCLAIMRTTKKRADDRRQFSQAVDRKSLLHVESREGAEQPRLRASTRVVLCPQLVKTTLDVTCFLQRWQRRCAMLIAELVGQPFYCRLRTKAMDGRSDSNYSHQIALKCRIDRQLLGFFTLHLCETGLHTTFRVSNG